MPTDLMSTRLRGDCPKSEPSAELANPAERREQLMGMILELQSNRVSIKRLRDWYTVFVFTGGDAPNSPYDRLAIAAYLKRPFATDRICIGEVERYRHLVEVAMGRGPQNVAEPRTLRCRSDLADVFDRTSSEIQTLETAIQSVLAKLLRELDSPPTATLDVKTAKTQPERS
jgi:hypothetical protein